MKKVTPLIEAVRAIVVKLQKDITSQRVTEELEQHYPGVSRNAASIRGALFLMAKEGKLFVSKAGNPREPTIYSATPGDKAGMVWKAHIPSLLKEIMNNPGCSALKIPLQLVANLLAQAATRASQLNDPILNALMCEMALYEIADPYSQSYDSKRVVELIEAGRASRSVLEARNSKRRGKTDEGAIPSESGH